MKNLLLRPALLLAALSAALLAFANSNSRTGDAIGVAVSPRKLLLGTTQSGSVLVHTSIPFSSVATSTLALNGLPAAWAFADSLGHLVASFNEIEVKAIEAPPMATLTLTGSYLAGEAFAGSDVVAVETYCGR